MFKKHKLFFALKQSFLLTIFSLAFFSVLSGQQSATEFSFDEDSVIPCAADHVHEQMMNTNPDYRKKHEALQEQLYRVAKSKLEQQKGQILKNNSLGSCIGGTNVLTIPIVVFIVHATADATPTDGTSNPTDAQIIQGIQDLNDAFSNVGAYAGHGHGYDDMANPDRLLLQSVDIEIQFCLAKRDINGDPTTGIYRTPNNTYANLDIDTEIPNMKAFVEGQVGVGLFPDTDYAGVWLHDQLCSVSSGLGCGIGGFAGPSLGVLNLARLFGSSTNGSTVHIHEFGHYLSLAHTWEGGCPNTDCLIDGDGVCDTPPDNSTVGIGCGTAENTCATDINSGPFTVDQDDLYENYMDYSTSSCQNTFTQGQKERMRASLLARSSLFESKGCIDPNILEAGIASFAFPGELACETTFSPILNIENNGNVAHSTIEFSVSINGGTATTVTKTVAIAAGASAQVTLDPVTIPGIGSHEIEIEITDINGVGSADSYVLNNSLCNSFIYAAPVTSLDHCEDIESGNLDNFVFEVFKGLDNSFDTLQAVCATNGSFALRVNTWENRGAISTTDKARIYYRITDLGSYLNPTLEFDLANIRSFSNFNTGLKVIASGDCGATMTTLYDKTSSELATVGGFETANTWRPTSCADWRTETIDLTDFGGCSGVLLIFEIDARNPTNSGFSSIGQNVYLDNICVKGTPCTALTNTTTSPVTITDCANPTNTSLTVGNKGAVIADENKEIVGWWLTKGVAINTTAIDKPTADAAINSAAVGGVLGADANVIYEGDVSTGTYDLAIDCNNLTDGETYYATPFVSKKELAIPTENCMSSYTDSPINVGADAGRRAGFNAGSIACAPVSPVNPPNFTMTITISNFTGTAGALRLRARLFSNCDFTSQYAQSVAGDGAYVLTEADFPAGFDPNANGMCFLIYESGSNSAGTATMAIDLDITYPGAPEVIFPTMTYSDCLFGTPISFTCNCASLPIELNRFTGRIDGKVNILEWATSSENNSQSFIVERSATGRDEWKAIGEVAAAQQSNQLSMYELTDESPLSLGYYRLRSIDQNGTAELSSMVVLERKAESTINVYPVPASESVNLDFFSPQSATTVITLTDVMGRTVHEYQWMTTEGQNTSSVDISHLSAGIYFVTLNNDHQKLTAKIVKE